MPFSDVTVTYCIVAIFVMIFLIIVRIINLKSITCKITKEMDEAIPDIYYHLNSTTDRLDDFEKDVQAKQLIDRISDIINPKNIKLAVKFD